MEAGDALIQYPYKMSMTITDASAITRGEGWLSAWVGQEHVMMSADTGTCISLSETGGRIWELLEEPRSLRDLCSALAQEYDAEPEALREDVVEFVERLQTEHALTVGEAA